MHAVVQGSRVRSEAVGRRPPSTSSTLGEHCLSRIGVARHQIPEPGHRVGGGLVAGEHERQRLVADPLAGPGPVVGAEQHVEQIGRFGGVREAVIEYVVDGLVECQRDLLRFAERRRQRHARERAPHQRLVDRPRHQAPQPEPAELLGAAQPAGGQVVHTAHQGPEVLAEQGVRDDSQRRLDHRRVHVELRAPRRCRR